MARDNSASPIDIDGLRPLEGLSKRTLFAMQINLDDVNRIAQLARLELPAAERSAMVEQLNGFFSIVDQMSAVDTRGVEPLYTPLSAVQAVALRLREDVVGERIEREANQRSAPATEDGLYLVPRVVGA